MTVRRYRDYVHPASLIASEVIEKGVSDGWAGSIEERDRLSITLNAYNIVYVDDMRGTWARRSGETTRVQEE